MNIRTRIILSALAVVALVCVVFFVYFLQQEKAGYNKRMEARIERTHAHLKGSLPGPLNDGNVDQLEAYFDSVFRSPHLVELFLTDYRGEISILRQREVERPVGEVIVSKVVITAGQDELGEVRTVYTTAVVEQALQNRRNGMLLFTLALMLTIGLVIYVVVQSFTRPILRLTDAARAMADGDLDRDIHTDGSHELAVLGQSFQRMRDAMREKIADLAANNQRLNEEIEQRREAEMDRDRLASIIEATTDLVSTSDPQGNITYLNRNGRIQLGIGNKPVEEMKLADFHPPESTAIIVNQVIPCAIDKGYWSGETELLAADGNRVPMSQVILSHKNEQGDLLYLSTIMRDISERKRVAQDLEHRVEQRTRDLQRVNEELEAFSYSVSHDLRAPLRAIDGFSQALLEDYAEVLDSLGADYLNRVRAASQNMADMIDGMLQFSRVTRSDIALEDIDLTALANRIIERYRLSEPQRDVEIRVEEGLHCRADSHLMGAVMENLLGNAWKYTAQTARPCICVGQELAGDEPSYYVRDNGAGFEMKYAHKLFGAFQRLHSKQEFSGTGIGLATVKRIISRHGGRIWCQAQVDEGATFFFTLGESSHNSRK